MLTLTGTGGIGKTRLALEAGLRLETQFADGVYFISLAGVGMTESIIPALADALGLAFSGPAEPLVQICNFLRARHTLLIVDNMEHLLEGASLLGELLQQAPQVRLLVTSREPLRLQWEWLFEVQSLPVPQTVDARLESHSAVALFLQRARQASQAFTLSEADTAALVHICKLVGGLPLAIELAASWVRMLSLREIVHELEKSLDLLETKKLDVPERHRSIRSVFDHSWSLLTDEERLLLMKLSVFQGGFTRSAAVSAVGATLAALSALVEKSLLRYRKDSDRYDLHELIRQYAFTKLQVDSTEEAESFRQIAEYFTEWLASLERPFKSAEQPQTSQLIRAETSNWLACWHWAIKNRRFDLLRRMALCLNWYFEVHGFYAEALSVFKAAVDHFRAAGAPASLRRDTEQAAFAFLVDSLGWFEFRIGRIEPAIALFAESLELAQAARDVEVLYYIHGNWGYLCLFTGDYSGAEQMTTASLEYGQRLTPWHTAIPISVLGIVAYQQADLNKARQQLTESLEIWRSVGDPRGLVFTMLYLGMATLGLDDIPATRAVLSESNAIAEANHDRWAHALGLDILGAVFLKEGQNEAALAYFHQSIALSREIGDPLGASQTIIHAGQAYAALRSNEQAKQLYLEAYASARQAKWIPVLLNALVSFAELPGGLSAQTKLAVALSVLSHSAITPNLRVRCEQMRADALASLTPHQIETAQQLARAKIAEAWAQEILQ
jgi:predicted ATPase